MQVLQIIAYSITILIGVSTIVGVFIGWRKRLIARLKAQLKALLKAQLKPINKVADNVNILMVEVLPSVIDGFEKKNFCPQGTLVNWTKSISRDKIYTKSPKELSEIGQNLLKESGMKKIIDDNIAELLKELKKELDERKLKSLLDIEKLSFYVFKDKENKEIANPIKDYIYKNPSINIDTVFFVGSIYLRNKYIEKYPKSSSG